MPDQKNIDIARAALLDMTPEATIGDLVSEAVEDDGSITLKFASRLAGYPGWTWTVSLAQVEGFDPTVLEAELIPADGALLAPDWVPWADRLADYKAAQEAAEAEAAAAAADELDADGSEDDDESEDDEDEDDDLLGSDVLHGGDLDGVDIDDLDEDADEDDDPDEDDDVEDVDADDEDDDLDESERAY